MAFDIEVIDSTGKVINETSFSVGVLGYWSDLASENNLPILEKLHDRSFNVGADIFGNELKCIHEECLALNALIEKDDSCNPPQKNGIIEKFSKAIGEDINFNNLSFCKDHGLIVNPNISGLNIFIGYIEIAIEHDGSICIC